jgi:chromate transporter
MAWYERAVPESLRADAVEGADPGGRSLRGLFFYFLRLGASGYGGPIALAGYMRRDLVQERAWYTEDEYAQGLAVAQTMPGPLAAQLAMWLGYLERGALGAFLVAVPFVIPPFLIVTAVAVLYAHYQGLSQVQSVFFGVGPAVIAIIAIASYKLARSTNKRDPVLWTMAIVICAATVISGSEIVWLFVAAGIFGAVHYGGGLPRLRSSTAGLAPFPLAAVKGFAWVGAAGSLGTMAIFFAKASALTFGSGLAVVPFLHQGLVVDHHWLTERQFTDSVAMGLISPGPVVIMGTFAGYLVGGIAGAVIATVAIFTPTYLFVVVPGRLFRRFERHPRLQGFVKGATAAAAGAIAGAAIVIGRQTISGWLAVLIALVGLALLLQKRVKVPEPALVALAAVAGLVLHYSQVLHRLGGRRAQDDRLAGRVGEEPGQVLGREARAATCGGWRDDAVEVLDVPKALECVRGCAAGFDAGVDADAGAAGGVLDRLEEWHRHGDLPLHGRV